MKKYSVLCLSLLFLLLITGCKKNVEPKSPEVNSNKPAPGKTESVEAAPNFVLTSTNGKDIKLSDYKGKVVIVDFWATWCAPCRKGIPDLVDIQKEFKNDVVVIGISLDQDTKSDVIPFMKKFDINYPVVYGSNEVVTDYGSINAIPTTFIIDKNGKIADKHIGLVPKSEFINKIKEILG
jgi:thiol-disulfide isomerase/thioredoxin